MGSCRLGTGCANVWVRSGKHEAEEFTPGSERLSSAGVLYPSVYVCHLMWDYWLLTTSSTTISTTVCVQKLTDWLSDYCRGPRLLSVTLCEQWWQFEKFLLEVQWSERKKIGENCIWMTVENNWLDKLPLHCTNPKTTMSHVATVGFINFTKFTDP